MRRALSIPLLLTLGCAKPSTESAKPSAVPSASATAVVSSTQAPAPVAKKNASLDDFMPARLGGIDRMKAIEGDFGPTPPDAAAAYLSQAIGKSINVNLMQVHDLKFSRAQFHGLAAGQTKESPAAKLSFKGFEVGGFKVERTQYLTESKKSEARALLADKVDVMVSVQPADNPDEAIDYLKQLDLAGIEAFAKTM
jgi:hypothetical protein